MSEDTLSKVAKFYRLLFSILWFNLILSLNFIFLLFQIHYHVIINYTLPYRKIPKISPRAYIFQRPFLRSLSTEGNLRFKIDYASLILEVHLPFLPCFTLYLRTIFHASTSPRGGIYLEGLNKTKEKNLNKIEPQHIQTSVNITFKLGNFSNFKALRSSGVDEFSLIGPCKKLKKKPWKGLFQKTAARETNSSRQSVFNREVLQGGNKTVLASDISFDQLLSFVGLKFTFPLFQTQSNRGSCFLDRKTAFILAR